MLKTAQGEIEYALAGSGTPVLVLHGAGGGYDQGLWIARVAFGEGYRFVAVSRYGYLGTPIPAGASIRGQAAAYRELLDYLGIERVIVVGASAGGPSATEFANDYPERTAALILVSAVSMAAAPEDQPAFWTGIIHLIQRSDLAYRLVTRCMRGTILSLMGIPRAVYRGFTAEQKRLAQAMLDTMHPMSRRRLGTVNDGEMIRRERVETGGIVASTLILHAKDDALVSFGHALHASESIHGARLIAFESGGHGLIPRMEEVRRAVREFLAGAARDQ